MSPEHPQEQYPAYQRPQTIQPEGSMGPYEPYVEGNAIEHMPEVTEHIVTNGEDMGRVKDKEVAHEIAHDLERFSSYDLEDSERREKALTNAVRSVLGKKAVTAALLEGYGSIEEAFDAVASTVAANHAATLEGRSPTSTAIDSLPGKGRVSSVLSDYDKLRTDAVQQNKIRERDTPSASKSSLQQFRDTVSRWREAP